MCVCDGIATVLPYPVSRPILLMQIAIVVVGIYGQSALSPLTMEIDGVPDYSVLVCGDGKLLNQFSVPIQEKRTCAAWHDMRYIAFCTQTYSTCLSWDVR
jgi:hypothetical protein